MSEELSRAISGMLEQFCRNLRDVAAGLRAVAERLGRLEQRMGQLERNASPTRPGREGT